MGLDPLVVQGCHDVMLKYLEQISIALQNDFHRCGITLSLFFGGSFNP